MSGTSVVIGGALAGSVAGSVAGAAIDRWPRGATLLRPLRSACGGCGRTLLARDLVPVVSWLLLRGRCRTCARPIGARLPAVEAVAALGVVAVLARHGADARGFVMVLGCLAMLVAAVIDVEHRIVPDRLTLPLAALGLATTLSLVAVDRRAAALGWAIGIPLLLRGLTFVADITGSARPIGHGDIKLLVGVLGIAGLTPGGPLAVLALAVLSGGAAGLVGLATGRLAPGSRLPFAPAIAAGLVVAVLLPDRAVALVTRLGGGPWLG